MRELEDLLPTLEPPPGGLERLRRSVAGTRPKVPVRRWRRAAAVAALCVAVVAAGTWTLRWQGRQAHNQAVAQAIRQALPPKPPANGIVLAHGAALELPSGQPDVKLYLVQSAKPGRR